ncbi:MAG: PD40 domain-containing protein [Theionarchaea archaeon]|nr:PD40 domain-containing protein [Theionarchaea archaeon]
MENATFVDSLDRFDNPQIFAFRRRKALYLIMGSWSPDGRKIAFTS